MMKSIREYWQDIENTDDIERGMYIIFPLRYSGKFEKIEIANFKSEEFKSDDFTDVLFEKCKKGNFVKRYIFEVKSIKENATKLCFDDEIPVEDIQLFVFSNGIAFLAVYIAYINSNVNYVYKFFNPGYFSESSKILEKQAAFINNIYKVVFGNNNDFSWYVQQGPTYIIKEAYRMNVAKVCKRFEEIIIVNQLTYNQHRMIDLTREFVDLSELDIGYTSGARDVEDCKYGWGCCITSQEISYTYNTNGQLIDRSQEDLLLTILAMHQRYTCFVLNEEIHKRYMESTHEKSIHDLKSEALEFIAYGTLAPSQVSRWNNVCETYRYLIKLNGIDEALDEIQHKITLLNDEQERIDLKRESMVGSIIAVFGLVSIIAAVLQVVDYVVNGGQIMITSFIIAISSIVLFGGVLLGIAFKQRRKHGDM